MYIPSCYSSRPTSRPPAWGMAKVCSSVNDFVLFPRDQPYMSPLDPRLGENFDSMHYQPHALSNMHPHGDFSGQASTSYEPYTPVSAYSFAPSAYFGPQNVLYETQKGNPGRSMLQQISSGSPSPSNSQAFDPPPSTLSSASGPSAQSTASSNNGSPYASATHALPNEDKWSGPLHGLGIPGIVSSEGFNQDPFPPANFENDLMLEESKFANFVGECGHEFSSSFPFSQSPTSSMFSGSASQSFAPASSSRRLVLDTTTVAKDITIDSILDEANSKIQMPLRSLSPVSAASAAASPTSVNSRHQTASPNQEKSSFKFPLTPVSAASRYPSRATSPQSSGDRVFPGSPVLPLDPARAPRSQQQSSEHCHPCYQSTSPPFSPRQALYCQFQSPFFGQSSGRLVARLESSCRFSLLSPSPSLSNTFRLFQIWFLPLASLLTTQS